MLGIFPECRRLNFISLSQLKGFQFHLFLVPPPWRMSHHQTVWGWMVGTKRAQFSAPETLSLTWSDSSLLVPVCHGCVSSLAFRGPYVGEGLTFDFCASMGKTFMKHLLFEINKETFGDLKMSLFLVCSCEICNNHKKSQIWINGNKSHIYILSVKWPPYFFFLIYTISCSWSTYMVLVYSSFITVSCDLIKKD